MNLIFKLAIFCCFQRSRGVSAQAACPQTLLSRAERGTSGAGQLIFKTVNSLLKNDRSVYLNRPGIKSVTAGAILLIINFYNHLYLMLVD